MYKHLKKNSGFSLLEVMVSVGIISILSLIAYGSYSGYRANAARAVAATNAKNVGDAYKVCKAAGGGCNSWESIKMDSLQGQDSVENGADAIAFDMVHATGSEVIKSCVSINHRTQKASYTIGWYSNSPLQNDNQEMLCFCADANQSNLILQGSEVICTDNSGCAGVGVASCPDVDSNTARTKQCLAQKGEAQNDGTCI